MEVGRQRATAQRSVPATLGGKQRSTVEPRTTGGEFFPLNDKYIGMGKKRKKLGEVDAADRSVARERMARQEAWWVS